MFCAEIHRPYRFYGAIVLSDVFPVPSHAAALRLLQLYTGLVSNNLVLSAWLLSQHTAPEAVDMQVPSTALLALRKGAAET